MQLYVLSNGAIVRAWDLAPGVYLVGSGVHCDRVLDPLECPWDILCQVEAQADRLIVTEIGEGVPLAGPAGRASLVVLKSFDCATAGPFELRALQELKPPDFLPGEPDWEEGPTAEYGTGSPRKEMLLFQVTTERGTRRLAVKHGFALGRHPGCAAKGLRLANLAVSVRHAVVREQKDGFFLVDAGSRNGTYVNGVRLSPGAELRLEPGMTVQLTRNPKVPKLEVLAAQDLVKGPATTGLVGESAALADIHAQIYEFKDAKFPLLLHGETGTGKEVLAGEIARLYNPRKPMTVVDCTTLTETLLEAELFGTVRGAFTEATDRPGLIEEAEGGVLFLDEIGDLPRELQAKFLRFLQEHTLRRRGSNKHVRVDCRVVAATHRDLPQLVAAGGFRRDLYERLAGKTLRLPPLRERKEDILPIARHFLENRDGTGPVGLSSAAGEALHDHDWPGNVRELLRLLEIAACRTKGGEIEEGIVRGLLADRAVSAGWGAAAPVRNGRERVRAYERALMAEALAGHGGKWNPAALAAGYAPNTFLRKAKQYGLLPE